MNIEDLGVKDKAKVEAIFHENPNYKAIVLLTESNNHIIKVEQFVPFTSLSKAQDYIDNELPKLGLSGLILKINEEERVMFGVKYTIKGVFGEVTFFKDFFNKTEEEILNMVPQLTSSENSYDHNNYFFIEIKNERGYEIYNSTNPIYGLPIGITYDTYYKMVTLQKSNNIINPEEVAEIVSKKVYTNINKKLISFGI